mmetsp:Transcript_19043/g.27389  ORF Transcript_19043/g.27389 Transcript_19043/m.27389 type:complete len:143 (+) Transcript_19043:89-517(+)|eukprot:CAMPEP_0202458538 /NCGR_PEP_ID=MMETSP1360-20130828/26431_1 /ASSEMBLY_ACC=CAM_ASM_000848 /TAXON_ID=515479 /ORGANISM="Licmophora paradoxa, Strain CCMP2313" /LENGTH=142 /DNA_ID=CAMNT_0049079129 /DNA_START=65 /DNA_END=493 /DNA_ORIENTATION=-
MQSLLTFFALFLVGASGFVGPNAFISTSSRTPSTSPFVDNREIYQPAALQRQRKSVASIQTQSLFGLGGPELAIILIAAAFLLGPQKLAELGKDAGKIAGELKEVPKEFQKGMAEGETQAKAIKEEIIGDIKKEENKEESKE